MSYVELFTISTDTLNGAVDGDSLHSAIEDHKDITTTLEGLIVKVATDYLGVQFDVEPSSAEKTVLTGIVAAHAGIPAPVDRQRTLWFHADPTFNGDERLLGWYEQTDTAQALDSSTPFTVAELGYHSHFAIDVSSAVGLPFTMRATGRSVDEASGTETPGDTEDIEVDANGFYQTSKSWIDDPQLSIVEASKSCTCDVFRLSYWDRGNRDFDLTGCRAEWTPDSANWSFTITVQHLQDDGSVVSIENTTFDDADSFPRAANGKVGKYKRTDYATSVRGSLREGLILKVNHQGISSFTLGFTYDI